MKTIKQSFICTLCALLVISLGACAGNQSTESGKTGSVTPSSALPTKTASSTAGTSAKPTAASELTPTPETTSTSEATSTTEPTPTPTEKPAVPTVAPGNETYAEGIKSDEPCEHRFKNQSNTHQQLDESIAIQFFATVAFDSLKITCPSYGDSLGTLVFTLYAWQGTYYDTLNEDNKPLATATFENYNDNKQNELVPEAPLPDGEYLLVLTSPDSSEGVGVWVQDNLTDDPETYMYANDTLLEGYAAEIFIHYVKTPNRLAGPLSDPGF